MVLTLALSLQAFAFSSGPSRSCTQHADCVLVKETHCGAFHAIALGQDRAWAEYEAAETAKAKKEGRPCSGPRPDLRSVEAVCVEKACAVSPRAK